MAVNEGSLIIVHEGTQVAAMANILRSPHIRAINVTENPEVEVVQLDRGISDALGLSANCERVIQPGTFLSKTLIEVIDQKISRGQVGDLLRGKKGHKTPEELLELFREKADRTPVRLIQSESRYHLYCLSTIELNRFVAHDVAEQLMLYKREVGNGAYTVIEDFLEHCKEGNLLGDAVLSMMIFKAYHKDERERVLKKLGVSSSIYNEIVSMFGSGNGEKLVLMEKRKRLSELAGKYGKQKGILDDAFLGTTFQPVTRAIVFSFNSLRSEMRTRLHRAYQSEYEDLETRKALVNSELEQITSDAGEDPADYIVLGDITVRNPFVPLPRKWMEKTDLYPSEILSAITTFYNLKVARV